MAGYNRVYVTFEIARLGRTQDSRSNIVLDVKPFIACLVLHNSPGFNDDK